MITVVSEESDASIFTIEWNPKDRGSTFAWNIGNDLPDYTAWHNRRKNSFRSGKPVIGPKLEPRSHEQEVTSVPRFSGLDRVDCWIFSNVHSRVHTLRGAWHLGRQMSQLSVHTKLETVSSNLHCYVQKQVQLLSLLSMNKCIVFLCFLNKGSTVIFCCLFSWALLVSLNFPFICVLSFYLLSFKATFCFINQVNCLTSMTFNPQLIRIREFSVFRKHS
jgi:hypothetical protein